MNHRRLAAAAFAATAAGGVLMAAGWSGHGTPHTPPDAGVIPAASAPPAAGSSRQSPPVSVRGPHGFHAPVTPVAATADGGLGLPDGGDRGGWWALGAAAGSAEGTVLIAGHVDTAAGLGAFAALHHLAPGERIEVIGADRHTYRYTITARRTYRRDALPADLFLPRGAHRIALVTCAGAYDEDNRLYSHNLVLYGTPTPEPMTPGAAELRNLTGFPVSSRVTG
ncbi:class F sortase [Streptomyces sp. ISL-36]|uniref:class F sortase n=1 Tax=Streptomyces sp. ISL-36 TaxID=2819182 RepID=UPI001BE8AAD2|nr:class F sortase [Streptomyces sp. ISL-36]MBT2444480.1 class F sortase [Streptomyces sp. ISL-36]